MLKKMVSAIVVIFSLVTGASSKETLQATVNAYAPVGHHFQGNNKYSSLATFNGNIYVFSMDSQRRPYISKIAETDRDSIKTSALDTDETDVYRVFDNDHHHFAIGIDKRGYIHVIGDMHHGNLGSKRNKSMENPLPARFRGSIGDQMYWISDRPEDIASFSFVGFDQLKAIPCNGLTYAHIEPDCNGQLYMAGRQSVRNPKTHIPGTMGLSLWRYDLLKKSWKELGGVFGDNYGFTGETAVFPSILWEPHGYARKAVWYQSYSHSLKFDRNNRLHLLSVVNADSIHDGSSHVIYAYSDDGGNTFFRINGERIGALPIRATGPEKNRGSILMTQGSPDTFDAEYFGLFWDKKRSPGFQFKQLKTQKSRYCYFDAGSRRMVAADFSLAVPGRHGDHYSLKSGSIAFIGTKRICIKNGFKDAGIGYYPSITGLPSGKYLLREIDDAVLRDRNILRGLSEKDGRSVVVSIDLNTLGDGLTP